MAQPYRGGTGLTRRHAWNAALALGLAGFTAWAVVSTGQGVLAVGATTIHALWLLPALIALHLFQLFLSAVAWRDLLPPGSRLTRLYRLRIIREGIDSLLPVAQVGGEIVGARLLAQDGVAMGMAAASVVVDVTLEVLTQLIFLLLGLAALALSAPDVAWEAWVGAAVLTAGSVGGLLAAQRFGVLRALEAFARQIAARWPGAGSLAGLDAAASTIYRRAGPLSRAGSLHLTAWILGAAESWAVLHAIGFGISPIQALAIEALGMAARSAGFAVPGALVVQETGFALATVAMGLPDTAGISLSLIKRAREIIVGLLGVIMWRLERR